MVHFPVPEPPPPSRKSSSLECRQIFRAVGDDSDVPPMKAACVHVMPLPLAEDSQAIVDRFSLYVSFHSQTESRDRQWAVVCQRRTYRSTNVGPPLSVVGLLVALDDPPSLVGPLCPLDKRKICPSTVDYEMKFQVVHIEPKQLRRWEAPYGPTSAANCKIRHQ
eukprot:scpid97954/ scgid32969/ 